MNKKIIIWLLVAIDLYLLFQQTSVEGGPDYVDVDASNSGDYVSDAYAYTIGAAVALTSAQTFSTNGVAFTRGFEGCRLTAYPDVGSYSIGWGTKPSFAGETITQDVADQRNLDALGAACSYVLSKVQVDLGQNQLDALTDWVYNLGSSKVSNATMWTKLNASDFDGAAAEFPRWKYKEVNGSPVVDQNLLNRRNQEASLFMTPDDDGGDS